MTGRWVVRGRRGVRRRAARGLVASVAAVVLLGGHVAASPAGVARPDGTAAAAAGEPAHYEGTLSSGATWVADVPAEWNRTTILYSHGFGPLVAQNAPDDETKQALFDRGYALVGSSYSGDSMWALENAVPDQLGALRALQRRIGRAKQTIAWGTSMGGLVSALEAEQASRQIDGALTTCGLVAGALNLNDYQLDGAHAIAELLAPGQDIQLVGYESDQEASAAAAELTAAVVAAQGTPEGRARTALAAAFFNLPGWYTTPTRPAADDYESQEQQQALELAYAIPFVVRGRPEIERSAGGNSSGNVGLDYDRVLARSGHRAQVTALYEAAGLDLAADLATLEREAATRAQRRAVRALTRTSHPTGEIRVPQLAVHTVADQIVPVEHGRWYRGQVRRAGRGGLLRQAYVERSGHCAFEPSETIGALRLLRKRVARGTWPDTGPADLNRAARRTGLPQEPAYVDFAPWRLTGVRPQR